MVDNTNISNKGLEKAQIKFEQAKQKLAKEMAKAKEEKRRAKRTINVSWAVLWQSIFKSATSLRKANWTVSYGQRCSQQIVETSCQQVGICGGRCLSCDSQKGKRSASAAC